MNEGQTASAVRANCGVYPTSMMRNASEFCRSCPVESLGVGIWMWHVPAGKMHFLSDWKELLGYAGSAPGAPPEDWESLIHPEDLASYFEGLDRYLQGKDPACKHEYRLRCGDGSYKWFLASGKTLELDDSGAPLHIFGTLIDINDRKELERSLAVQQSRYRSVLETIIDGIVVIDSRGIIQSVNPSAERIFGYAAGELIGSSVNQLMPEPYRSAHDGYLRRYAETGEARIIGYGREAVGLRKNGETFPISLAVGEMRIDGKLYFTGIVRDITTRKRSEEALLIAASVYRSMGEAILVTDADNNIITVNEPFTRLTGYELHELIGKNPKVLASGRQDSAFYEDMWRCLNTEGRWRGELWNRRKNGQHYLESLSINIIYDEHGDVLRHVAVFSEAEA